MADDDWETADLEPKRPTILARPGGYAAAAGTGAVAAPAVPPSIPDPERGTEGRQGDDEWFRGPRPASNRQIWDTANQAGPSIMPSATAAPPPKMQILKRPSKPKATGASSTSGSSTPSKSIEQREEEYRLARERIFGTGGESAGSSSPSESAPGVPAPMGWPAGAPVPTQMQGRRSGPSSRSTSGRGTPRVDENANALARAVDRLAIGDERSPTSPGQRRSANSGGGYVPAQAYTHGYTQVSYSAHSGGQYQYTGYQQQYTYPQQQQQYGGTSYQQPGNSSNYPQQSPQYYSGYAYAPGAPAAPSQPSQPAPPVHPGPPGNPPHRVSATPPVNPPQRVSATPPAPGTRPSISTTTLPTSRVTASPGGVLRQPRGPGSGGGFGAVGSGAR